MLPDHVFLPAIPIAVCDKFSIDPTDEDNTFAALKYHNHIRKVSLKLKNSQLEKVAMAMRVPFPALSQLRIWLITPRHELETFSEPVLTLPDGFLGGNASSLQKISFSGISIHALPALLSSANNLISLHLAGVFDFFAPGTLVASLAAKTTLEDLSIEFAFGRLPRSKKMSSPPPSRAVLPALTRFQFHGEYKYLENLVAHIDCPQLKFIDVMYHDDVTRSSQLFQFIGRSEVLKRAPFRRARVNLGQVSIDLDGSQADPHPSHLRVEFPFGHYELRYMRRFLVPASAILTTVRHLSVLHNEYGYFEYMGIADWIEFFRLFPSVETLHLGGIMVAEEPIGPVFKTSIDPVFNELTVAGVLPALRFLSLDGTPTRSVLQFISARQASGCPVTLVKTREELEMYEACCETVGVVDKHTV
jgi:hypothetical protein